jgi:hypothetical protein
MPVDLYTDLAELYCSNPKTGRTISIDFIVRTKDVQGARERETQRHEQDPHQTAATRASTKRHKKFLRVWIDLVDILQRAYAHYWPGPRVVSHAQPESVATPVRKTHLGYIDAHEPQHDESHDAQTPTSTAVAQSDGTQFRSRLDSSDRNKDMTQADVDGTPDLTEYYPEVTENHSAVMECWNQVSRGVISSVNAAVCGNIGLHLMETSIIRWSLIQTDGLQQDDFISKLLELH